ncbi:MAG: ABC transporter permease [Terriglobales bacterium]
MQSLIQDFRYGLRVLVKTPGFTVVAVLTLALGIGANTAIFSMVNAVLLRPLPYRDSRQLVSLGNFDPRQTPAIPNGATSYPDAMDVRSRNHSFAEVSVFQDNDSTLTGIGEPLHVNIETVSANLFRLLGTQPSVGRAFLDTEDNAGHHVVILSDAFWRAHFNADRNVIGRTVNLTGRAFTVVGVMPPGFQFPVRAQARDLWVTFSRQSEVDDPKDKPITAQRGNHSVEMIARLKPGVTLDQANADLASISHALAAEYPASNLHESMGARSELDSIVGDTRESLLILFGAVGLVLLIACANVANLMLVRSMNRAREIAIRAALGASRGGIVRQLIAESLLLSCASAVLGVGAAQWGLSAILRLYPDNLPRASEIGIDYRVLLFTVGLAMLTGVVFGLVPALQVSKPNLTEAMREGGRGTTAGASHNRLRSGLVILETALGIVLLAGAGLPIRSFNRLSHTDLGFNPEHVLTATFDLSETRYNSDQQDQFVREFLTRVKALPGVSGASGAMPLPLYDDLWRISFNQLDHPVPEESRPDAGIYVVAPGFFETMQIPLLRGRTFDERDQRNSAPVMIVTQQFVKKFFPNEDPIGRKIEIGAGEGAARSRYRTREIVGVVGDIRTSKLTAAPPAAFYVPLPQLMWGAPVLTIRSTLAAGTVETEVRKVLAGMDPDAPLYKVQTMEDYLALDLGRARFQAMLLGLFAGIALLLTAIGLYGVMSFTVLQRTHEIGIRVALGAGRGDVLRMVVNQSLALTGIGLGIGMIGAVALTRLLENLLYEVKPADPATLVAVSVVLIAVSALASYIPARRAAGVDPMVALRYE